MKRVFPLLLIIAAFLAPVQAQIYLGVHGGVSLPQGFYADSRMSDNEWMFTQGHQLKAGSGRGYLGGLDLSLAMPFHRALELTLAADYMVSSPNRDVRDYYELIYSLRYANCSRYEMQLPKIQNIPILLGVRYAYPASSTIDFYGEALAGMNIRYISPWTLSFATSDWIQTDGQQFTDFNNADTCTYAPATTFSLRLGAGFIVKKKVTLGATFTMLGSAPLVWDRHTVTRHSIYGHVMENTADAHVDYYPINPTMVTIHLGYRFNPFKNSRHVQDW